MDVTLCCHPPELLLGETRYDECTDLWLAGFILVKLVLGNVLFPRKDETYKLKLIFAIMGTLYSVTWWFRQVLRNIIPIHIDFLNFFNKVHQGHKIVVKGLCIRMIRGRNLTTYFLFHPCLIKTLIRIYTTFSTTGYKQHFFHNNNILTTTINVHNQTPE